MHTQSCLTHGFCDDRQRHVYFVMTHTDTYILWWHRLTRVFWHDTDWESSYHLGNHSTSSMMRNLLIGGDWVLSAYSIDKACVWVIRNASNDAKTTVVLEKIWEANNLVWDIWAINSPSNIFHVISTCCKKQCRASYALTNFWIK